MRLSSPAYADDLALLTWGVPGMSAQLDKVLRYAKWAGLRLNVPKCAIRGIGTNGGADEEIHRNIRVGGSRVPYMSPSRPYIIDTMHRYDAIICMLGVSYPPRTHLVPPRTPRVLLVLCYLEYIDHGELKYVLKIDTRVRLHVKSRETQYRIVAISVLSDFSRAVFSGKNFICKNGISGHAFLLSNAHT